MKKKYGSFRTGFLKFLRMVKTEYTEGDKLPPADVICKRLKISRNTYSKILKEAHGHAHVMLKLGCGVFVQSPSLLKVGVYLGRGEYSPMIKHPFLLCKIITMLNEMEISTHIITQPEPEKLPEELLEKNISLLLAFDWDDYDKPELDIVFRNTFQKSGIPILLLKLSQQKNFNIPGVYRVDNNEEFAMREIVQFAKTHGFRQIFSTHTLVRQYRPPPGLENCCTFSWPDSRKIFENPDSFLHLLRRKKPDLLLLGGKTEFCLSAFSVIRRLAVKNRPAILCYKDKDTVSPLFKQESHDLNLLGTFHYSIDIYAETAVDMIASYLIKKRPLQDFGVNNFQIDLHSSEKLTTGSAE